jgi:hypothetical protein
MRTFGFRNHLYLMGRHFTASFTREAGSAKPQTATRRSPLPSAGAKNYEQQQLWNSSRLPNCAGCWNFNGVYRCAGGSRCHFQTIEISDLVSPWIVPHWWARLIVNTALFQRVCRIAHQLQIYYNNNCIIIIVIIMDIVYYNSIQNFLLFVCCQRT